MQNEKDKYDFILIKLSLFSVFLFRIRKYMNFKARDIVGLSAYEFYHSNDMQIVHKGHHDCKFMLFVSNFN